MNTWGSKLKISIFGESHGEGIGVVIDGIPSGIELDMDFIRREMQRRAPGTDQLSTPRKEADEVEILSGIFQGKTSGTPICGIIRNTSARSKDYIPNLLRPGHADFTGFQKYGDSHDFRGGGHCSGRITAPKSSRSMVTQAISFKISCGSIFFFIDPLSDGFGNVHWKSLRDSVFSVFQYSF